MKTVTKTYEVYDYIQLPEDVKEKIREKERNDEFYPGDWWWEGLVMDFVEKMKTQGWNLDDNDVHIDISYCQGSGASFDATLDIYKYMKVNKIISKYPQLAKAAKEGLVTGETHTNSFSNHYCHFNTRFFNVNIDDMDGETPSILKELEGLEGFIEEDREQICRQLEKDAYEAYEYYFKDEVIDENLIANEARFEIDGTPFYD